MTEYFKIGKLVSVFGLKGELILQHNLGKKSSLKGFWGCYLIKGKVTKEFNFFTIEVSFIEKLKWWNWK